MAKLKKKDFILGGKIHCPDCGGDWWVSGPQAIDMAKHGWPKLCGNHPDVPGTGSQNHCTGDTPLEFIPYDVEANIAEFQRQGYHDVAAEIPVAVERILADTGEEVI